MENTFLKSVRMKRERGRRKGGGEEGREGGRVEQERVGNENGSSDIKAGKRERGK